MLNKSFLIVLSLIVLSFMVVGCPSPLPVWRECYSLDQDASGVNEMVNNIASLTVVSRDDNELRAEYRAGFVQGKLQERTILSARDNTWDNAYLTDPDHSFPQQPGPTPAELEKAASILNENYTYFIKYLKTTPDSDAARKLSRLLFRMLGIYHGATLAEPASLDYSGSWLPDAAYFQPAELTLEYETPSLTFMDVYFLNAFNDLTYVISYSPELGGAGIAPGEKCSAFLKRTSDEVILTHNTWQGFLSQSMAMTLFVNDDFLTVNASNPGLIGSGTDFGYNNKGIMFNETTHRLSHTVTKTDALWIFWRATLAEQFSTSIR